MPFQSTQPEWAATTKAGRRKKYLKISIHAAQEGCDGNAHIPLALAIIFQSTQPEWAATAVGFSVCFRRKYFNPRSPSGLRLIVQSSDELWTLFQSTQPEWAATSITDRLHITVAHFNPRSPSGLRLIKL